MIKFDKATEVLLKLDGFKHWRDVEYKWCVGSDGDGGCENKRTPLFIRIHQGRKEYALACEEHFNENWNGLWEPYE